MIVARIEVKIPDDLYERLVGLVIVLEGGVRGRLSRHVRAAIEMYLDATSVSIVTKVGRKWRWVLDRVEEYVSPLEKTVVSEEELPEILGVRGVRLLRAVGLLSAMGALRRNKDGTVTLIRPSTLPLQRAVKRLREAFPENYVVSRSELERVLSEEEIKILVEAGVLRRIGEGAYLFLGGGA